MSGDQQAQGHAQVLANMLDFGANPQAASDAARFSHSQRTNQLVLEGELFDAVGPALKAMGHDVARGNGRRMGGYQAIMIDPVRLGESAAMAFHHLPRPSGDETSTHRFFGVSSETGRASEVGDPRHPLKPRLTFSIYELRTSFDMCGAKCFLRSRLVVTER